MFRRRRTLTSTTDRGPLRVMFVISIMPVGGAETALVELVRRMDRKRFLPELCCLKYLDVLGEVLANEIPAFTGLLAHKYDFGVLTRLTRLLHERKIDAVVTVGTGGDKMFWGRIAAKLAGVPVICSSLHSTGLPDHVELPNRLLSPITDAFIAVAEPHGQYLAEREGCPAEKIVVIPNGVDVERFHPRWPVQSLRAEFNLNDRTPVVGIVAALRPEKNHEMFLRTAAAVHQKMPAVKFMIVGDGVQRPMLEEMARSLGISDAVIFTGTRSDVPEVLSLFDAAVLTSWMEANPLCVLEAMAAEKPVVATQVGSVPETVLDGRTGYLVHSDDDALMADRVCKLLGDRDLAGTIGRAAREMVISHWSVDAMVQGYENLIAGIYASKCGKPRKFETETQSPSSLEFDTMMPSLT